MRYEIFEYIKEKYDAAPEYLWAKFPNYAIFRHSDNKKWFACVIDVPGEKLGLEGKEKIDILNVKIDDPLMYDVLIGQDGFFKGYHMSRGSWISILLDGTVSFDETMRYIEVSYAATASKKKKDKIRPPKEWLIPANPKYYDIGAAFERSEVLEWKHGSIVRPGDTVYIYMAAPVSAILYQCKVTQSDIPYNNTDEPDVKSIMLIRLTKRYPPDKFTFAVLKEKYGIRAVRGPRGITDSLSAALKRSDTL